MTQATEPMATLPESVSPSNTANTDLPGLDLRTRDELNMLSCDLEVMNGVVLQAQEAFEDRDVEKTSPFELLVIAQKAYLALRVTEVYARNAQEKLSEIVGRGN